MKKMNNEIKQKNITPWRISLASTLLEENFFKINHSKELAKLHLLQFDFTKDTKNTIN
jgi:hypothetical protein